MSSRTRQTARNYGEDLASIALSRAGGSSPTPPTPPTIAIFRPGVATAAPFYATWAEVKAIIDAVQGAADVYVDTSSGPAVISISTNCQGRTVFHALDMDVAGTPTVLTIANGIQLTNPAGFEGLLDVQSASTTVPAFVLTSDLYLGLGARLNLIVPATQPLFNVTAGALTVYMDSDAQVFQSVGIPFANVSVGAQLNLRYTRRFLVVQNNVDVGGGPGSALNVYFDSSAWIQPSGSFTGTYQQIAMGVANRLNQANVAIIGPGGPGTPIDFDSPASLVSLATGIFRAYGSVTFETANPSETATINLTFNSVIPVGSPSMVVTTDPVTNRGNASLTWVFTGALNTTHDFGLRVTPAVGVNVTIQALQAVIVAEELRGIQ